MIKIFDANDKDFSSAGNIIIEPIKCHEIKKKSLNGWWLDVEVPIKYAEYISKDKLCVVQTKSKLNPQAFRIGEEIQRSTRRIKFKAEHVMFDARDYALIDVRPTNQNGLNALNYINKRTDEVSPFIMHSNVEAINTAYFIRKNLLEAWTTIEERWGGLFDADNWNISFLTSVGNDNGETVAYGKNMQGFDIYEDWSSVCTKLCPVGYDGLMLPEQFLISDVEYEKPYTRIIDFQTDLEVEEQTEENLLQELRTKGNEYLEENKIPKVSYTIISNINDKLEIGDTIKVLHPYVNIFTEVLEYEYNLISKKLLSLTFGNYSRDVKTKFNNIKNTIEQINQSVSKQEVVINNQTNLINSLNKNGYVYIDENEILILDTIPKEKAKNVWRFGLGGIGFSSNGYEGPFEVAMTMDGQINANFITTGTLSVSRIEGLANFISETEKQISNIEIQQGNITSRVESVEGNIVNLQSQIDGSIQFWNGSEIPTASNYPASDWATEEEKNKHRADIYTVIEDIDGELKQGKSYRFDKVANTWQWIELTDNELSAVQALAQSKAKVFVTTPKVPYNVGDLWLNNGKLLECQTAKDANGSYSAADWKEAVNYTDDTVANLAKALANNAQSTADSAVEGVVNITNTTAHAEGKNIHITDSAEEPLVDISLHGETKQATRSGKNLLPIVPAQTSTVNGITFTSNGDGSYSVKGTSTALTQIFFDLPFEVQLPNSTLYCHIRNNATSNVTLLLYNETSGAAPGFNEINRIMTTASLNNLYMTRIGVKIVAGLTVDINFTPSIELTGEVTAYEPYGASPSPDFPSQIENVEGKNLFDKSNVVLGKRLGTAGEELTAEGYFISDFIKITSKAIYTKNSPIADAYHRFAYYSTNDISGFISVTSSNIYSTPANAQYLRFCGLETELDNTQLEEGTVATEYVPYNSLAVKVTGKNLWNNETFATNMSSNIYEKTENGFIFNRGEATGGRWVSQNINLKAGETITFSYMKEGVNTSLYLYEGAVYGTVIKNSVGTSLTYTADKDILIICTIIINSNCNSLIADNIQIEKSTVATEYEPYKEQTIYFPLAEGQKLMEGSYLADDGVHNVRGQVVLDGSDDENWSVQTAKLYSIPKSLLENINAPANSKTMKCNYFTIALYNVNQLINTFSTGTNYINFNYDDGAGGIDNWRAWLSENPITVEYELAEEEIVSYTEEQQEAWNNIRALNTYKNVTNITSDAFAKIVYMRDNGLDVYETKQNADKRYTETTEKLAETKITTDSIKDTVSETNKRLTNDYLTAEQVNAEIDGTKEEVEILRQRQASTELTTEEFKIQFDKINNEGVSKVKTSMGYTFNDEGMHVNKEGAETGTIVDEAGVSVLDKTGSQDTKLLYAGYVKEGDTDFPDYVGQTIVASANMIVQKYLVVGTNTRFEDYVNPELGGKGTGAFEI